MPPQPSIPLDIDRLPSSATDVAPAPRHAYVRTTSNVWSDSDASARVSNSVSWEHSFAPPAPYQPPTVPVWASIGRMCTAPLPLSRQHGIPAPQSSMPPPEPHPHALRLHGRVAGQAPSAISEVRRPLAAWVRRFRRDPPLPRGQRLPYAPDPAAGLATEEPAPRHDGGRSADALLEEAQRAIASLGSHQAPNPDSAAGLSEQPSDRASLPLSANLHGQLPPAITVQRRRFVAAGIDLLAERRRQTEARRSGADSVIAAGSAWDAVSDSEDDSGGRTEDHEDGEDLLERWRRRQHAHKVLCSCDASVQHDGKPSATWQLSCHCGCAHHQTTHATFCLQATIAEASQKASLRLAAHAEDRAVAHLSTMLLKVAAVPSRCSVWTLLGSPCSPITLLCRSLTAVQACRAPSQGQP